MKKNWQCILAVIATFMWGLLAHAYGFFNDAFSHDCLNSLIADATEEKWKIALGRYLVPVYRNLVRGGITLPWLIGLLGIFWTALAVCVVIKIFNVQNEILIVLISGVMVTNITYTSQIATYLYEYDFNAFALLMSVLAVYIWIKYRDTSKIIVESLFVFISLGIYQAYISVTLTLIMCCLINDLFIEVSLKDIIKKGVRALEMVLFGGAAYYIVGKLISFLSGIGQESRTDVLSFGNVEHPILYYLHLFIETIILIPRKLFHVAYGSKSIVAIVMLLTVLVVASAIYTMINEKYEIKRILLISVFAAALLFFMNCIHFLSRGASHDLMIYAVWFFYVIVLLFTYWFSSQDFERKRWKKVPYLLSCVLVAVVLWQNVLVANTAYMKKNLEDKSAYAAMTRVVSMMESYEEYDFGKTTVAFIGTDGVYGTMEEFSNIKGITGMEKNNPFFYAGTSWYYDTYDAYFRYILNYPINLVDRKGYMELVEKNEVKEMTSFPEKGCMKMIDDVLVVKMGD